MVGIEENLDLDGSSEFKQDEINVNENNLGSSSGYSFDIILFNAKSILFSIVQVILTLAYL